MYLLLSHQSSRRCGEHETDKLLSCNLCTTIFHFVCLLLFNTVRYPPGQMRAFVDRMATNGQHWMCLVNPGIAVAKGFRAFEEGTREGIFIKDYQGNDYVGQVSGPTTS